MQGSIEIAGNVTGAITVYDNASVGGISISSGGSVSGEIENQGTISGGITIAEGSSVKGDIANFGTVTEKIEVASGASVQGNIQNNGNVQEEVKIAGNVGGEIVVLKGASAKNISISGGSVKRQELKIEGSCSRKVIRKFQKVEHGKGNIENKGQVAQAIEISGKVGGEITITEKASVGKLEIASTGSVDKGVTNSGIIKRKSN